MTRRVVLVCGPPGSGKTTYAHQLGLTVYDADDPHWPTEAVFRSAIAKLANDRRAQAVVIRSGATRSARDKASMLIGANQIIVLDVDELTCIQRVKDRSTSNQLVHREIAAIRAWWARYEPPAADPPLETSEAW